MLTMDEKRAFAARLKAALKRSPKKIETADDLATLFSVRFGKPVTQQAVHKWLSGSAMPTPDKIADLADWLDVSEKWLRYGLTDESRGPRRRPEMREPHAPSAAEWALLERMRTMPEARRRLVEDLVEQLCLDVEIWKRS